MKNLIIKTGVALLFVVSLVACNETIVDKKYTPYNPNQPIQIDRFYPDSGGMATKIILEGSNFGLGKDETNPNARVKVYFNKKQAAVVRSIGEMIYAITPRQPGKGDAAGDTCVISVVVGTDSVVYKNQQFMYYTTTTVSTIAGVPSTLSAAEQDAERTGGTLSVARFSRPRFLGCDSEGNVYMSDWNAVWGSGCFYLINQDADVVQQIGGNVRAGAPCLDPDGTKMWLPDDGGTNIYTFDLKSEFEQSTVAPRTLNADLWKYQYKHSLASSIYDGYIYTVTCLAGNSNNYLAKIDPIAKTIEPVLDMIATDESGTTINNEDSWCFLAFDPVNPKYLYISLYHKHAISRYNLETKEYESAWAGAKGAADHVDGRRANARFKNPSQLCVDYDGNVFVADAGNHCIRRISQDGIVTTVIGQPTINGYRDGGPDDALFDFPEGVTVTPDNSVWVADTNNDVLRKLAIE